MNRSVRRAEFTAFVESRADTLVRFAYLLTGDRADAEGLLEAALVQTFLSWPRVRQREGPEAHVKQAVVTAYLSQRPAPRRLPTQLPTGLWGRICALTPRQRTTLVLRHYENLTIEEVSHLMRCPVTVAETLHQEALRAVTGPLGDTDPPQDRSVHHEQ